MREALALAGGALERDDMPVGAVVALDGDVLASAAWRFDAAGLLDHAELVALRLAEKDPRVSGRRPDVTLYTTLEPCLLCMGAAMSFGAGRVVFALEAPYDGAADVIDVWQPDLGFPPAGYRIFSRPEVVGGVCRDAALALMQKYVERKPDVSWLRAMLPGFAYPEP